MPESGEWQDDKVFFKADIPSSPELPGLGSPGQMLVMSDEGDRLVWADPPQPMAGPSGSQGPAGCEGPQGPPGPMGHPGVMCPCPLGRVTLWWRRLRIGK